MKRRIMGAIVALLMAIMLMPAALFAEGIRGTLEPSWTVPEGYNEHDYNKLATFLELVQPDGYTNGWHINSNYSPNDPMTWYNSGTGTSIEWVESGSGLMLRSVKYNFAAVRGDLDLSGCEMLYELRIVQCPLFSLDVSDCSALHDLSCAYCGLYQINISGCESIYEVNCPINNLTEIDISDCINMAMFTCFSNEISALDFTNNTELILICCDRNRLAELDVSSCNNLIQLTCTENQIASLTLPLSETMMDLRVDVNELTELDVSSLENLETLSCGYNHLSDIDVTSNPHLKELYVPRNELTYVDLSENPDLERVNLEFNEEITLLYPEYDANRFFFLDLMDNPLLPLDTVLVDGLYSGGGSFGYFFDYWLDEEGNEFGLLKLLAMPDEGYQFVGWFTNDGNFLSSDSYWTFDRDPDEIGNIVVAKFSEVGAILPGDIDMSGEVSVADAIMALRAAMGILDLTPGQTGAADMNGNGTIEVTDAIMILRIAMGIN